MASIKRTSSCVICKFETQPLLTSSIIRDHTVADPKVEGAIESILSRIRSNQSSKNQASTTITPKSIPRTMCCSDDEASNPEVEKSVALVIIDIQNEFMDPRGNFPANSACRGYVKENLKKLIPHFRKKIGHIIWVQAIYENRTKEPKAMAAEVKGGGIVANNEWLSAATHVFHIPCCEKNTWGAQILPELFEYADPKDTIVTKGGYSGLHGTTELKKVFYDKNIVEAYFCGVASGTCVLATVVDAVKMKCFDVNVIPDCMGWRRENTHHEAMKRYEALGVNVVCTKEFFQGIDDRGPHA